MTARSRAYPVESLAAAVGDAATVLDGLGRGRFDRETLAGALGYRSADGGLAARKIAALAQYGLLDRRQGRYRPTELAERAVSPTHAAERAEALEEAVYNPPLFRDVLGRFEPQGRLPPHLPNVLFRDFGITSVASEKAARVLVESAREAGVVDAEGRFVAGPRRASPVPPSAERLRERPPADGEPVQRIELTLTGGKMVQIVLPRMLNRRDLEILEKQMEIWRLQVE